MQWTGEDASLQTGKLFLDSLRGAVEKRDWQALESLLKLSSLQVREQETNCLGMGNQTEDYSEEMLSPSQNSDLFLKSFAFSI